MWYVVLTYQRFQIYSSILYLTIVKLNIVSIGIENILL